MMSGILLRSRPFNFSLPIKRSGAAVFVALLNDESELPRRTDSGRSFRAWTVFILVGSMLIPSLGCRGFRKNVALPSNDTFEREQLRIFSDLRLPRRHRLLDELSARRRDIADRLLLPMSDEPINVYVFDDERRFARYLKQNHPSFPTRRAFFVKNDTDLNVYTHWGEHIGEDLRHEVTHGYLHSVVPNLPLWMDEGLAEYFELPRGENGFHRQHVYYLTDLVKNDERWRPSLSKLESLNQAPELTQTDYAESWLWIHFLVETKPEFRSLLQDQLARIRMKGETEPLSKYLAKMEVTEDDLLTHLGELAKQMKADE